MDHPTSHRPTIFRRIIAAFLFVLLTDEDAAFFFGLTVLAVVAIIVFTTS